MSKHGTVITIELHRLSLNGVGVLPQAGVTGKERD
jgi:hypothetical protein